MADIGERLGGDNIEFTVDQPLRIIIGGPPHSGKSTMMNLLEDRFRYYQIPVELLDLDLYSPTPLKTGFTEQREKRKGGWTNTLADEARLMFEEAEGVEVVLGDSVGLISEINEIISQPADVAILLVSGGHGDYDTTYRKVVRKWKEYYTEIRKPLLVVLRSTMNPSDESMFDAQDNYGVIVGMDRDAYDQRVISGHHEYTGLYPTNACLEGVIFEITQSFDLKVRSPTDPEHLEVLNSKWPDLKDKKTWIPPEGSMLGGIERAYFEERGRVPADQRAESYSAETWWTNCEKCGASTNHNMMLTREDYYVFACSKCNTPKQVAAGDEYLFDNSLSSAESFGAEHGSGQACCFCGDTIIGYGNNPAPLDEFPNKCCSDCNLQLVIPARMRMMFEGRSESFGAESKMCSYCKTTDLKNFSQGWDDYCMACARRHHREYGAESCPHSTVTKHREFQPFEQQWAEWEECDKCGFVLNAEESFASHATHSAINRGYQIDRTIKNSIRAKADTTRKQINQDMMFSQLLIASLIGLGAGLWGVSKWSERKNFGE